MSGSWIATYRLQLHAGFPLSAAQQVLGYLAELGISHVYLSPCLQAVPGSLHGYDVVDPGKISDDLGGEAAWVAFVRAARELKLRILLDVVPNHMSASQYNPLVGRRVATGTLQPIRRFFRYQKSPRPTVLRASVFARQALWGGIGGRRTLHRDHGERTARQAL